jgi:hypothetical protein
LAALVPAEESVEEALELGMKVPRLTWYRTPWSFIIDDDKLI